MCEIDLRESSGKRIYPYRNGIVEFNVPLDTVVISETGCLGGDKFADYECFRLKLMFVRIA